MSPRRSGLGTLLAHREVVVTCGPGGVGKTTIAAALAAAVAVREERRVLVITVDPARRLADTLHVGPLADEPRRIPTAALRSAGASPRGQLFASMLDTRRSWEGLVSRHAPDRATAERILANPAYRNLTGRFSRSHEFAVTERLAELHASGRYDLIVVDTPPARDALDLLDAPTRWRELLASPVVRLIAAPARSRLLGLASRPILPIAERILGTRLLTDLGEFFASFTTMEPGLSARAEVVDGLLRGPATTFALVTTAEGPPVAEMERTVGELATRGCHLGLLVANRVLPDACRAPAGAATAEALVGGAGALAGELTTAAPGVFPDRARLARALREVGENHLALRVAADREASLLAGLAARHEVHARIPRLAGGVGDLRDLLTVGSHLLGGGPPTPRRAQRGRGDAPVP